MSTYGLGFPIVGEVCQVDCHGWNSLNNAQFMHLTDHHINKKKLCETDIRSYYVYGEANDKFFTNTYMRVADGYTDVKQPYGSSAIPGSVLGGSGRPVIKSFVPGGTVDPTPPTPIVVPAAPVGEITYNTNSWMAVEDNIVQDYEVTELVIAGYRLLDNDTTPIVVTVYNDAGVQVGYDASYEFGEVISVSLSIAPEWIHLTDLVDSYIIGMCIATDGSGDVYVHVRDVGIYKQTAGAGNFVFLQSLTGGGKLAVAPNGDKFIFVGASLYKAANGVDTFTDTGGLLPGTTDESDVTDMAFNSEGDLFFTITFGTSTRGVWKIATPSGTPETSTLYLTRVHCGGIAITPSDDIYISYISTTTWATYVAIQTASTGSFIEAASYVWYNPYGLEINPVTGDVYLFTSFGYPIYTVTGGIFSISSYEPPYFGGSFTTFAYDPITFAPDGTLYWASSLERDGVAYLPPTSVSNFGHVEFSGGEFALIGLLFSDAEAVDPTGKRLKPKYSKHASSVGENTLIQTHILEVL